MSKALVQTHAGDDSDGKIWGVEGLNILFLLAGLILSVGLSLLLFRQHPPTFSFSLGGMPLVLCTAYVFGLRQGKPKSYDNDLLETLATGSGWMPSARQPRLPLDERP